MQSTEVVRSDSLDDADPEPVYAGTAATANQAGLYARVFYVTLFLKDQSAVISLLLVNHQNHVTSFRCAAMKPRLPIST